ncbi:MAG: hypothetical protein AAFQ74_20920 [Cyanobacteria bacterium J06623_4]
MKKLYAIIAGIAVTLPLAYLLNRQAQAAHARELQACSRKFEQIRADAAEYPSVDQYPFEEHRWTYDRVSEFVGGVAVFSNTREGRKQRGFVDFNNNVVLEFYDPVGVDTFPGFAGFEDGHTPIFVWEHDSVPLGFLLPYGNPIPRVHGTLDCTGKVILRREGLPMPTFYW